MLKMINVVLVFVLCSAFGYIYGESFKRRYMQLQESFRILTLLQNGIIFNNIPLPECFKEISEKCDNPIKTLLLNVSEDLNNGVEGNLYSIFKENYKGVESDFYLEKEDKGIFKELLKSLGELGVYGQEKIFKLTLENLKINIDDAYDKAKKNTKLYRYIGMCVGAMLSIFLLWC